MATLLQLRWDTLANWTSNNPILAEREFVLETDTGKQKVGDWVNNYLSLSYTTSNATHTGDATGSTALTVVKINGTSLAGLATGILKNTTITGVPSIAAAWDFPTLNQNTTGSAATITTARTIAGVSFDGSANIAIASTGLSDTASIALLTTTQTFTNKTLTSPVINTPTGIVKWDVWLWNVDNTSNATERAATATLTNKRITSRVASTTDAAISAINTDTTDLYALTAVVNATTFTLTGTPTNGQKLMIRFKDAWTAEALTWIGFTAIWVSLPTTTVAGKNHYVGCIYSSWTTRWEVIAVWVEA